MASFVKQTDLQMFLLKQNKTNCEIDIRFRYLQTFLVIFLLNKIVKKNLLKPKIIVY